MTGVVSSVITFITCLVKNRSNGLKIQSRFEWMDGWGIWHMRARTHHCDLKNLLVKVELINYIY